MFFLVVFFLELSSLGLTWEWLVLESVGHKELLNVFSCLLFSETMSVVYRIQ